MRALRFETVGDLKKTIRSRHANGEMADNEDLSLVDTVESLKHKISATNANLDNTADPLLIEGFIYELKSLHVKYDYVLKQCKERGLTADFY